jgi:hypothetical protein
VSAAVSQPDRRMDGFGESCEDEVEILGWHGEDETDSGDVFVSRAPTGTHQSQKSVDMKLVTI